MVAPKVISIDNPKNNSNSNYQVDYLGKRFVIPNGEASSYTYKFYAGAKEIKLLDILCIAICLW